MASTYDVILTSARKSFIAAVGGLTNPSRRDLREALDTAIVEVIPADNQTLAEVLASNLTIGYPDDASHLEGSNIFEMIRNSLNESIDIDLASDFEKAVEDAGIDDEDEDDGDDDDDA